MKPDKPGEWHSRDGRKIVVWRYPATGDLNWRDLDSYEITRGIVSLPGDDWLPAIAPKFPELPARPPETRPTFWCCVRTRGNPDRILWRGFRRENSRAIHAKHEQATAALVYEYEIVPHPDNDKEAEEIIRAAHKLQ